MSISFFISLFFIVLTIQVKYAMARDVRLDDLGVMIEKLGNWASTTQVLLATLEVSQECVRGRTVIYLSAPLPDIKNSPNP